MNPFLLYRKPLLLLLPLGNTLVPNYGTVLVLCGSDKNTISRDGFDDACW